MSIIQERKDVPMTSERSIKIPRSLYKEILHYSMENNHSFDSCFKIINCNPDFVLDENGTTIWMLWNQICNKETIARTKKAIVIEKIMQKFHADDCNYLRTLYKRGGFGLLKEIRAIHTDININACDKNGFTILDHLLKETEIKNEDINELRELGYRFGLNLTQILGDYLLKSSKGDPEYTINDSEYKKQFYFLKTRVKDAQARGINLNIEHRLLVFRQIAYGEGDAEIFYSFNLIEPKKESDSCIDNVITLNEKIYNTYIDNACNVVSATKTTTLNAILNDEKLTIDKTIEFEPEPKEED